MPESDRRIRTISLRLSEVEYEVLKTHYRTCGARSVSDLARLALQRIVTGSAGPQDGFGSRLSDLDKRVHALESRVALMAQPKPPRAESSAEDPGVFRSAAKSEAV